jgi:urea transport system permease protein
MALATRPKLCPIVLQQQWGGRSCLPCFLGLSLVLLGAVTLSLAADLPATRPAVESLLPLLVSDDFAVKKKTIDDLGHSADMRVIPFLEAYNQGSVYRWDGRIVLGLEERTNAAGDKEVPLLDPLSRLPVVGKEGKPVVAAKKDLKDTSAGRRERVLVRDALTLLRLSDPDSRHRLAAIIKAGDSGNDANLPALRELLKTEKEKKVRSGVEESIALIELTRAFDPADPKSLETHLAAVNRLGDLCSGRALSRIQELSRGNAKGGRPGSAQAAQAYAAAIAKIEKWQTTAEWISNVFAGVSSGSILVLMALGLSIIFGLMGVINMAHGELMMIGAYATYETQKAFLRWMPTSAFDWYYVAAIPVSFIAAAVAGYLLEVLLIRWLYGRTLDTLLATSGVALILTQIARVRYGDSIAVNAPSWLQGGVEVMQDVTLPYARLFILAFCVACVLLMYFIISRTKLGLLLRATTQSRQMSGALGVSTRRIDAYTFALGAGLAGLAGCALTPIGGVTPDMGQNYIVDSFLVVVSGGVGKLAGAIWAGLGLGMLNKLLEPIFQTVWAKVIVLGLVVLFLQWRPSGLFPAKGRLADA